MMCMKQNFRMVFYFDESQPSKGFDFCPLIRLPTIKDGKAFAKMKSSSISILISSDQKNLIPITQSIMASAARRKQKRKDTHKNQD